MSLPNDAELASALDIVRRVFGATHDDLVASEAEVAAAANTIAEQEKHIHELEAEIASLQRGVADG